MTKEIIIIITNSKIYNLNQKKYSYIQITLYDHLNNISLKKNNSYKIIGFTISKITDEFIIHYRDLENDFNHIAKNSFEIFKIINNYLKNIKNQ